MFTRCKTPCGWMRLYSPLPNQPDKCLSVQMWLKIYEMLCKELVLILYSDWEIILKAVLKEPDGLSF